MPALSPISLSSEWEATVSEGSVRGPSRASRRCGRVEPEAEGAKIEVHDSTRELLRESELLSKDEAFEYYDVDGKPQTLALEAGTLAFTYCQVPVVYRRGEKEGLTLYLRDQTVQELNGSVLDPGLSREIFARSGKIVRVDVSLPTVGELL